MMDGFVLQARSEVVSPTERKAYQYRVADVGINESFVLKFIEHVSLSVSLESLYIYIYMILSIL